MKQGEIMKQTTSNLTKGFVTLFLLFHTTVSVAQNKVVVVPLAGDDAAPGLAGFAGGNQATVLGVTTVVGRSVTMTFPSSGKAIVNASGYTTTTSTTPYLVRCSIVKNQTTLDFNALFNNSVAATNGAEMAASFSAIRGFDVNAEETTFNLVCNRHTGGTVFLRDSNLTVMFFPDS